MPDSLNVLVTGANGFVGSHLLRHFSEKDQYKVSGLVRQTSNLSRLCDKQYSLLYGSINDPLERIMSGFDAVIHTAANTTYWGNSDEVYKTNVEGTINLLKASVSAGVRRFIHFSSTVVYGFDGNIDTVESSDLRPFKSGYCRSKAMAEKELQQASQDIELVILRPSNIFGPSDIVFTYLIMQAVEKGIFFAFPKQGKTLTSPCYVKNIVSAVESALRTRTGFGEAYNITDGRDMQWKAYLGIIAEEFGKEPPRMSVPVKPLFCTAKILEGLYTLLRVKSRPFITPHDIVHVSEDYSFSIEKAKTKLGYNPPYTTEQGIEETVRWYRELEGR
jgi:nucleoside-diphosphate-sugar epimerase